MTTLATIVLATAHCLIAQTPSDRWESAIAKFEAEDRDHPPPPGAIVFVGSSTIRLWKVSESFPGIECINRGFGGSQMADSARYADRIVTPYKPRTVVVYAGDNDIAAGKSPEQVESDARSLAAAVLYKLPKTRIIFVAIKPSVARWNLYEKMRDANRRIAAFTQQDPRLTFVDVGPHMLGGDGKPRPELFVKDGLHLSQEGYAIWSTKLLPELTKSSENLIPNKVRLVVLTDIGGDPDDQQSLVRLLIHSDQFNIEGLIATSRMRHGDDTRADLIQQLIGGYERVRPNLLLHSPAFPPAEQLLQRVQAGQPIAGPKRPVSDSIGDGKDTKASDWIVSIVDKPDPDPIWITIWGGSADLAQALWKIEHQRSAAELAAFKSKVRVYAINDQDSTGPWIRQTHPDIKYITAYHAYRGLYRDGDGSCVTRDWVDSNVNSRGPLGQLYPNYDGGDPWGRVLGVKEGDTPSFLYLLPNGLGEPEHPTWGSWGGRFTGTGPQFSDTKDRWFVENSERATVFRWRSAYQNAFAARMSWCTLRPNEANHPPIAAIAGPQARTVMAGSRVDLDSDGSRDTDGDSLAFDWTFYPSFDGEDTTPPAIDRHDQTTASFIAPDVSSPRVLHVVLSVTDSGKPPLTSYQRVVVMVVPRTVPQPQP